MRLVARWYRAGYLAARGGNCHAPVLADDRRATRHTELAGYVDRGGTRSATRWLLVPRCALGNDLLGDAIGRKSHPAPLLGVLDGLPAPYA